jgi:hypothetical protein
MKLVVIKHSSGSRYFFGQFPQHFVFRHAQLRPYRRETETHRYSKQQIQLRVLYAVTFLSRI